jgi:hypothetical protein
MTIGTWQGRRYRVGVSAIQFSGFKDKEKMKLSSTKKVKVAMNG